MRIYKPLPPSEHQFFPLYRGERRKYGSEETPGEGEEVMGGRRSYRGEEKLWEVE